MSFDPTSLEADLRRLRAAGLQASLLDRLEASADGSWEKLTPEELGLERQLHSVAPTPLSSTLMASLEATVQALPFPNQETIIRFPAAKPATPRAKHRGWWSAAAAVALTGAITALLVPTNRGHENIADTQNNNKPGAIEMPTQTRGNLIPAGFNRGISEATDEGVVWQSDNAPHRVLKVVYKDLVTYKDTDGRTYQVEQPRVEYILVPEKTD